MARIRTVKPDFFADEDIGALNRETRLLFIATWTLADDEGLLRWSVPYVKANVFMYDDDLDVEAVAAAMAELEEAQMILRYRGGKTQQWFGWIVNFRRHQKINRPQPGKMPAPSVQNREVVEAYCRRDEWRCAICGEEVIEEALERPGINRAKPSLDHIQPRSEGGSNYPSNLRLAHKGCNSSRGTKPVPGVSEGWDDEDVNDSLKDSVNDSLTEGKGREGKGRENSGSAHARDPDPASPYQPVLATLDRTAFARGLPSPKIAVTVEACRRFAHCDLENEAEKFHHYWTEGPGEKRALSDVAWSWRNWLERAKPATATAPSTASARDSVAEDLRRLEAEAERLRAEETAGA